MIVSLFSNHGESHLTSSDENENKNKSDHDVTCYCGKKCKGLRGLRTHQRSCVASNLDDLKALFTQISATNHQQTNNADGKSRSPQ